MRTLACIIFMLWKEYTICQENEVLLLFFLHKHEYRIQTWCALKLTGALSSCECIKFVHIDHNLYFTEQLKYQTIAKCVWDLCSKDNLGRLKNLACSGQHWAYRTSICAK